MSDDRVNWSEMVWDLIRLGLHPVQIAKKVRVSRSTVIRWRDDNREPLWATGNRFIRYWASVTNNDVRHPPRCSST